MIQRFSLGDILATPTAIDVLRDSNEDASVYLKRHASGDWGNVSAADARLNEDALRDGARILSAYIIQSGVRIWVLTEADRSATTLLLPEEY